MSTEQELNKVLTAVREWSFQDLMAAGAMLTAESKHAEADDVSYAIGRKALADEAWLALIARLRALLAGLDAAREDAERYRHIRMRGSFGETEELMSSDQVVYVSIGFRGHNIDAAIDAARKGEA